MTSFVKHCKTRAAYAQCRIVHQSLDSANPRLSPSLLKYILKNPQRYGFKSLVQNKRRRACFVVSTTPDFAEESTQKPSCDFTYGMVVYPTALVEPGSESHHSSLSLFVVVLYNQEFVFENLPQGTRVDDGIPLKEYLDDGFYLGDIVHYAQSRVRLLIEKVSFELN